jgi:hypothetical protein
VADEKTIEQLVEVKGGEYAKLIATLNEDGTVTWSYEEVKKDDLMTALGLQEAT